MKNRIDSFDLFLMYMIICIGGMIACFCWLISSNNAQHKKNEHFYRSVGNSFQEVDHRKMSVLIFKGQSVAPDGTSDNTYYDGGVYLVVDSTNHTYNAIIKPDGRIIKLS